MISKRIYESLRRDTSFGPVIVPSGGTYSSIFAWDSGWNYFWLKNISLKAASEELLTLARTAKADGKIPHETVYKKNDDYSLIRRLQLRLLRNTFDSGKASVFIDPPVYLWAAADLLSTSGELSQSDSDFLKKTSDNMLRWIAEKRTITGLPEPFGSLPLILHPLESGTDLSPAFDDIYGGLPRLLLSLLTIQRKMKAEDWVLDKTGSRRPSWLVFDLTYISFYLLSLEKFGRLDKKLALTFFNNFYNREKQCFDSWYLYKNKLKRTENPTFSSMLPFLTDIAEDDTLKAAVSRHCRPGGTFWKGKLPSYTAAKSSRRSPHLWRGSCSWMNMNYCSYLLLKKAGFENEAEMLADAARKACSESELPEYFDAFTLAPGGASIFSWNGLADAMI